MENKSLSQASINRLKRSPLVISILAIIALFYDFGFDQNHQQQSLLDGLYTLTLFVGIVSTIARYLRKTERPPFRVLVFDSISILLFSTIIINGAKLVKGISFFDFFDNSAWYYGAIFLVFIREFASVRINMNRTYLNPAQVFIVSFLGIILTGAFLLLLPNATHEGISFINAIFTSTSAVCVTGLAVVDTGSYFTFFGQCIILTLFQIGGLGIMTFASYFGYFFRGGTSYENRLILSDMTNSNKLGEVFSTLKNIILVTVTIEAIGAILIYSNIDATIMPSFFDRSFFSIFHSVSAFCNAGFSTLSNSFYTEGFQFNYGIHGIAMLMFIIGGLGFPIVFNLFNYLNYLIKQRLIPFLLREKSENMVTPWVLNLNTRITLITSFALFFLGSIVFYFFEYDNTLAAHGSFGKIMTAMFGAATPRTAGFSVVDTSSLRFSTLMLIFLLMWVGASPASTGGGIKTSTFAIATLNFWSLARGKTRIEVFRREIADISVRRSFAIISLSLVVIGSGVFVITYLENDKDLLGIAFECFSAYSTVGLSIGLTPQLSSASKFVIIMIMFIGRVSMLSILIALIRKEKFKNYRYSKEEILIN